MQDLNTQYAKVGRKKCSKKFFVYVFFQNKPIIQDEIGLFSYSRELSRTGQPPTKERGKQKALHKEGLFNSPSKIRTNELTYLCLNEKFDCPTHSL